MAQNFESVTLAWTGRLRIVRRPARFRRFANAAVIAVAVPAFVVISYWAKSAAGINLMDGPSPLHAWLYWR